MPMAVSALDAVARQFEQSRRHGDTHARLLVSERNVHGEIHQGRHHGDAREGTGRFQWTVLAASGELLALNVIAQGARGVVVIATHMRGFAGIAHARSSWSESVVKSKHAILVGCRAAAVCATTHIST